VAERAYHFVSNTLRCGSPIPADGEWLEHEGVIEICRSGLHASLCPFDALQYAPGNTLCLVELEGVEGRQADKVVARRRRIVARIDAEPLMREFARWSALQVIELWDAPDVVRQYLTTGDESLRDAARAAAWDAARDAAWDAARAAARDAAWDAARAAAWDAAWDAARAAAWGAARAAAWAAAWAAARDAAWDAARAAARDAAWDAQSQRFRSMAEAAFAEQLEAA
jgi:hypothetical protein